MAKNPGIGKNDRRSKFNRTDTRKMLEGQNLCKSQTNSEIYERLKNDGQLKRFVACIQYCSSKGMNIDSALQFILQHFGGFLNKKEFTRECFVKLLNTYGIFGSAWGMGIDGDEINRTMLKNRAFELALKGSMEDIKTYNELYDAVTKSVEDSKPVFNFNINK